MKSKLPHRKFTIAIDVTYQPYYGDKPNPWIHPYKPVKGATGCYNFAGRASIDASSSSPSQCP